MSTSHPDEILTMVRSSGWLRDQIILTPIRFRTLWFDFHWSLFRRVQFTISHHQWWHHQMETLSALLALSKGNPTVTGGLPSQRPVTWSFWCFLWFAPSRTNSLFFKRFKRLSKQSRCRLYETPSRYDVTVLIISDNGLIVYWTNDGIFYWPIKCTCRMSFRAEMPNYEDRANYVDQFLLFW